VNTVSDGVPAPDEAALAAMSDEDFAAVIRAAIPHSADPATWDALTSSSVIARTKLALTAIHLDVESQLSLASARFEAARGDGWQAYTDVKAEHADWRHRALGFRRILQQRLRQVKSRMPAPVPHQPAEPGQSRRRFASALEELARAIAAHRDHVLHSDGTNDDADDESDDNLWDCLDLVLLPDGHGGEQSLASWLAYLDKARQDEAGGRA
jgi:hypothetical protein